MARSDLGRRPYRVGAFAEPTMRLSNDLRKTVVVIGIGEDDEFEPAGSGFLILWKGCRYLVTCHHVIYPIGDAPFTIRVNKTAGAALHAEYDDMVWAKVFPWFSPKDPTIDLAILPFNIDLDAEDCDHRPLGEDMLLSSERAAELNVGVGDDCYAIGLFRLLSGTSRNVPLVHSGNIALMAGEERIPVTNWRDGPDEPKTVSCDAHLAEMSTLEGLSGSPVFVRTSWGLAFPAGGDGTSRKAQLPEARVGLLGVWQSAWKGDPCLTLRREFGDKKVPVGIGAVVPAAHLIDLLERDDVADNRKAFRDYLARASASKPD